MAIYQILQYPDPRLKTIGRKVDDFGPEMQQVIDNMFETHYAAPNCAALAATQLDMPTPPYITVIDFSPERNQPMCLVNGEIIAREGEVIGEEACMSVGGNISENVKRAEKIQVKAQDRHGKPMEFEADGFLARCIQHELDHLEGIVFLDRLSSLKRKRAEKRMLRNIRLMQKN
jgi:peptide deformylase